MARMLDAVAARPGSPDHDHARTRRTSSSRWPARSSPTPAGPLTLQESTYPAVQYIPIEDVERSLLERTDTATYCPFKGDASYYSIPVGGEAVGGRHLGV